LNLLLRELHPPQNVFQASQKQGDRFACQKGTADLPLNWLFQIIEQTLIFLLAEFVGQEIHECSDEESEDLQVIRFLE